MVTVTELRFAWAALVVLLLVSPPPGSATAWIAALALIAPGTWFLAHEQWVGRAIDGIRTSPLSRPGRLSLVIIGCLVTVTAYIFSFSAAMVLAVVLATAGLFAARRSSGGLETLLSRTVSIGIVLLVTGLFIEFVAGYLLARRLGAPSELLAWDQRYDSLTTSNMFHFRSPYETVAKPPGVKRVWALGDSFTWGDKLARTEETWPAQLERELRTSGQVQVVNTGHKGWNLENKAELLRRFGWQWQPDLIVLQYSLDDALPGGPNFRLPRSEPTRILPIRFRQGAIERSALLVLAERGVSGWSFGGFAATYRPDGASWRVVEHALREIGDSAAAHHVPVIIMFYNAMQPEWAAQGSPERAALKQVASVARASGLDVLDLQPIFDSAGGDWRRWWATPYDAHPNAASHRIAALAVAKRIREREYLGPSGPDPDPTRAVVKR